MARPVKILEMLPYELAEFKRLTQAPASSESDPIVLLRHRRLSQCEMPECLRVSVACANYWPRLFNLACIVYLRDQPSRDRRPNGPVATVE